MEIPKRPGEKWDGSPKDLTLDCPRCEWYRRIGERDLCGWGEAFKYLSKSRQRRCSLRNKQSDNPSVIYLDSIMQNETSR